MLVDSDTPRRLLLVCKLILLLPSMVVLIVFPFGFGRITSVDWPNCFCINWRLLAGRDAPSTNHTSRAFHYSCLHQQFIILRAAVVANTVSEGSSSSCKDVTLTTWVKNVLSPPAPPSASFSVLFRNPRLWSCIIPRPILFVSFIFQAPGH